MVDECGVESLEVEGNIPKLLSQGSSGDIDLAIVYVKGLVNIDVLSLSYASKEAETPFSIEGFKPHKSDSYPPLFLS